MPRAEKRWLAWCTVAFLSFLGLEARALYKGRSEDTLTFFLRKRLGIEPPKPWRAVGVGFVMGVSGWASVHLATGKLVPKILRASGKDSG